jgi:hypothetical protein
MHLSRFFRRGILFLALLALAMPLAALADSGKRGNDDCKGCRTFYATDTGGSLLRFGSDNPRKVRSKAITGLPQGVTVKGIDFRPASGDLYALGSDRVVYRQNPRTAIAVPEGKSFDMSPSILSGTVNGFDFNPTVDKIRVTSDAGDNIRLNPDDGTLLSVDTKLTPAGVQIVGSAYTNSSFTAFATRPTVTELYAYDIGASPDKLWIQRPANAGTLIMPVSTWLELGSNLGFDIAGANNVGWLAGTPKGRYASRLYRLDVNTGRTKSLGRIGDGSHTITGLAAVRISRRLTGRVGAWTARPDPVSQHPEPLDFELDDIAGLEPPAVAVLEDAAGADRPRAQGIARQELRVAGRVGDDRLPRVVHIPELAAGSLLAVDASDHRPGGAVELVRGDDNRPQARREVLALRRTEPDLHLRPLEVPRRPVVHDGEAADLPFVADDRRHLELVVELLRPFGVGDLRFGAADHGWVGEVEDGDPVPLLGHLQPAPGPRSLDVLLERVEVANGRRMEHRR